MLQIWMKLMVLMLLMMSNLTIMTMMMILMLIQIMILEMILMMILVRILQCGPDIRPDILADRARLPPHLFVWPSRPVAWLAAPPGCPVGGCPIAAR